MAYVRFNRENLKKILERLETHGLAFCMIETAEYGMLGNKKAKIEITGGYGSNIDETLELKDDKLELVEFKKEVRTKL